MITGTVRPGLRADPDLTLIGPSGKSAVIRFMLDTGYSGYLLLTPQLVSELGLEYIGDSPAMLAKAALVRMPIFEAIVQWDEDRRAVAADCSDGTPLVGLGLLERHRIHRRRRVRPRHHLPLVVTSPA